MGDDDVIKRLKQLREFREQRASEEVARQRRKVDEARQRVRDAADASAAHVELALREEQAAIDAVVGRPVAPHLILGLHGRARKSAVAAAELVAEQRDAENAVDTQLRSLEEARADHRRRTKAVTKLDELLVQLASRTATRTLALSELSSEESGPRGPEGSADVRTGNGSSANE